MAVCSSNAMWEDINGKPGSAVYNKSVGNVSRGGVIAVTDANGNVLSALQSKLSGNVGIVYFSDRAASLSSARFVTGGAYSGNFGSFGYAESGAVSGGHHRAAAVTHPEAVADNICLPKECETYKIVCIVKISFDKVTYE